jgi:hypothetical protein
VLNGDEADLELYALRVAHGFRPPITANVPVQVAAIIKSCWAGDPELRPNIADVVRDLKKVQESGVAYRKIYEFYWGF